MNTARQLVETVFSHGGQLWIDGELVRYRAPTEVIEPLLPSLREHKAEVAQILQLEQRGRVFRALVDNKRLTVIMPDVIPLAEAERLLRCRFGAHRVQSVDLRAAR